MAVQIIASICFIINNIDTEVKSIQKVAARLENGRDAELDPGFDRSSAAARNAARGIPENILLGCFRSEGSQRAHRNRSILWMRAQCDGPPNVAPTTISRMTRENWAKIGITTEFLIVVRTLGEFFRLRYALGPNFSTAAAALYVGGALIAACCCWASVTFYFFRRYALSAWIALATVIALLAYKIAAIGW